MNRKHIIIWEGDDDVETFCITVPTDECLEFATSHQIAVKDVPEGKPFWLTSEHSLPADRTYRDAWRIDEETLGEPDGYGGVGFDFEEGVLPDDYL